MISRGNKLLRLSALGLLGAALLGTPVWSQAAQQPAPDNSKTNKQERSTSTADKQKMNPADRETAQRTAPLFTTTKRFPPTRTTSR